MHPLFCAKQRLFDNLVPEDTGCYFISQNVCFLFSFARHQIMCYIFYRICSHNSDWI